MKQLNAEIVAVGTELLLGQIANTNAQWLSEQLAKYGINVFYHTVVGDNLNRVKQAFSLAEDRADIIIVTGGLGPTEDDMTREAFQLISQMELEIHEPTMKKIQAFYANQQRQMTPNNKKQARVFKGCQVLDNRAGMAPGMIVSHRDKTWIFLPGVPSEMKHLVNRQVFPYLKRLTGNQDIIKSTVLKFTGIGESQLEHEIADLIRSQTNPTIAPLAQHNGVVIRVTAKAETEEKASDLIKNVKESILKRVGDYFYGVDQETMEAQIITQLVKQNQTVSAAESLTGGMFTDKLISVEGASAVCPGGMITYDAKIKQRLLGVPEELIKEYGTVSQECALAMAKKVLSKMNTSIGMGFTGVAGPGELEGKPAGTGYVALCTNDGYEQVEPFLFSGSRNTVRRRATLKGLEILFKYLKSED
jgi:nicotinamide-nucleotide amidase